MQAIQDQIEAGNLNISIWRVVTDAAVVAVQSPARWFIPLVAISNILRTITLALQIMAESRLPVRMHWVASKQPLPCISTCVIGIVISRIILCNLWLQDLALHVLCSCLAKAKLLYDQ